MKTCALILFWLVASFGYSQTVEVITDKLVFTGEEEILFGVRCASEQDLEITVFTDNHLAMQQKTTLLPGINSFNLKTTGMPNGKYFILVTGNAIHVEKEFHLKH